MPTLTDDQRIILLKLARSLITSELTKDKRILKLREIPLALKEKRGCFV